MDEYFCLECNLQYKEEPGPQNSPTYRLLKCPNCGHRLGVLKNLPLKEANVREEDELF